MWQEHIGILLYREIIGLRVCCYSEHAFKYLLIFQYLYVIRTSLSFYPKIPMFLVVIALFIFLKKQKLIHVFL